MAIAKASINSCKANAVAGLLNFCYGQLFSSRDFFIQCGDAASQKKSANIAAVIFCYQTNSFNPKFCVWNIRASLAKIPKHEARKGHKILKNNSFNDADCQRKIGKNSD